MTETPLLWNEIADVGRAQVELLQKCGTPQDGIDYLLHKWLIALVTQNLTNQRHADEARDFLIHQGFVNAQES